MSYSYDEFVYDFKLGHEIEFSYCGINYFATYDDRGVVLLNLDEKSVEIFKTHDDFLENVVIDSKSIFDVWDKIIIKFIY